MHSTIWNRQEVFSSEKIVGHATAGIEKLRCTDGAGATPTPARKRHVEVVSHGPTD